MEIAKIEELYKACDLFTKSLAHRYARKMPRGSIYDFEELSGIGNEVFMRCCENYDAQKYDCKFSSFFWRCLENEYKNLLKSAHVEVKYLSKAREVCQAEISLPTPVRTPFVTERELHTHIVKRLSDQAARVFACMVNPHQELATRALRQYKRKARKQSGYKMSHVRVTQNMIAKHLNLHRMQVSKSVGEIRRVCQAENIGL